MKPQHRLSSLIRIAFQAVLILLISFIAGEITLRVYDYFNPIPIFYDDSYNRFHGKPFAEDYDFKLNSNGFKDKEFTPKTQGIYRIMGIGDSFTFGVVPYQYNYLTLLEAQLNQTAGPVEVLNLGIPAIGPDDYLSLFVHEGLAFEPDMVLLSFFIGNDFLDSRPEPQQREYYTYSYVASLLYYLRTIRPTYEGVTVHGNRQYCDECPTFENDLFLTIERERSYLYLDGNEDFPQDLTEALSYLQQIREICDRHQIKLVLVMIPDEVQVNADLQAELIATFDPAISPDAWHTSYPNEKLAEGLDRLAVPYIDLYQPFAQASTSRRLYRVRDTHWNIDGNQLAADLISDQLRQFIPKTD
jgi:hypothetical protein